MDGTPVARMADEITRNLIAGKLPQEPESSTSEPVKPVKLSFEIDSGLEKTIMQARREFEEAVGENQLHYLSYRKYGKEAIKKQKTSPDGWCAAEITV